MSSLKHALRSSAAADASQQNRCVPTVLLSGPQANDRIKQACSLCACRHFLRNFTSPTAISLYHTSLTGPTTPPSRTIVMKFQTSEKTFHSSHPHFLSLGNRLRRVDLSARVLHRCPIERSPSRAVPYLLFGCCVSKASKAALKHARKSCAYWCGRRRKRKAQQWRKPKLGMKSMNPNWV